MPIYEYRCSKCGFQDEYLQKVSEPLLKVCPSCGKAKFEKLLSAPGFHLKGSGWYATDFKGVSKPKEGSQEAQDKSASKDKQEAKSKEQHAAKEDTKTTKEPAPAATTTSTKAPLPATTAGKADK